MTETNPNGETTAIEAGENTYQPPETQAELDRIIEGRLQRERAKYSDYNELKAKAEASDTLKAELGELKTKVRTLEASNDTYKHNEEVRQWRDEVSKDTGVPAELIKGDTKEDMQQHAATLGKYINVAAPVVSGDGKSPSTAAGSATRDLFANALEGLI